eukprot:TRINITY_DN12566_c1_g1_i1.p1 TRINITY_DN12566_c1_g1~~TRINITY_DN12566_c1_g1_i1.p1  ORF type:complete len:314 (+),score=113.05 TRINITY_DN12566_c1_g1_i1:1443-2384(+)
MGRGFTIFSGLVSVVATLVFDSFHIVNEGYVAVYWRGGALLPDTAGPGLHVKLPFLDRYEEVLVITQTDSVSRIPCGTSGGVTVNFAKIEVVNRLRIDKVAETIRDYGIHYDKLWVFDKIHHEINQFCSKHTLHEVYIEKFDVLDEMLAKKLQDDCDKNNIGISILAVRVTKPEIPQTIKDTFVALEESKQNMLLKTEQLKLQERESEMALSKARAAAEKAQKVREIELNTLILEENKKREMAKIEDVMRSERVRSEADAEAYRVRILAEAEALRLTDSKLKEILYTSIANSTKMYFGENIPKMFASFADGMR